MLIAVLFGTSVMVSASTPANKTATTKEVKMTKHPKHKKAKTEKKSAMPEATAPKAK
ncbi:hypothetical protein CLU82_1340 [Flavobacterium sp. 5]|nr:hypothetical protein CLU82_1340 [Flavobacterium sp. 5]